MSWTAAIIVSAKRAQLVFDAILPDVVATQPDQILIVGDFLPAQTVVAGWKPLWTYLPVPALTHTTNDALVKRDVAAQACTSDWIAYFSDDHMPAPDFGVNLRQLTNPEFEPDSAYPEYSDVYVPMRVASQPGHVGERLNMGESEHYCGGHAGVFRKSVIERFPWSAGPHHREWDKLNSYRHQDAGVRYVWTDRLTVIDVEPGASPWM